jgi:hypothetical protein
VARIAVKAKEKEMKDEKEAERKVSVTNKLAPLPRAIDW